MKKLKNFTALIVLTAVLLPGCENPDPAPETTKNLGRIMQTSPWESLIVTKGPNTYRVKQGYMTSNEDFWTKDTLLEGMRLTLTYEDRTKSYLILPEDKEEIKKAADVTIEGFDPESFGSLIPMKMVFTKKGGQDRAEADFEIAILRLNFVQIRPAEIAKQLNMLKPEISRYYTFDDPEGVNRAFQQFTLEGIYDLEEPSHAGFIPIFDDPRWEALPPSVIRRISKDMYEEEGTLKLGLQYPHIEVKIGEDRYRKSVNGTYPIYVLRKE